MRNIRLVLCLAATVAAALSVNAAASPAPLLPAAHWASCGTISTRIAGGSVRVRASHIQAYGVGCVHARLVVRGFYAQIIGSSGAGYAYGYGCAYINDGHRVTCGSGASGRGPGKIRWAEKLLG